MGKNMKKLILFVFVICITISSCKNSGDNEKVNIIRMKDQQTQPETAEKVDPEKVVAKVNGVEILQKDLRNKTLDQVIGNEILYIEAKNRGIVDKIQHKLPEGKRIIAINAMRTLFMSNNFKKTEPTQEEIENEYKKMADRFTYVSLYMVEITGSEKDAIKVKKEFDKITKPENFESLEKKFADQKVRVVVNQTSSAKYSEFADYIKPEEGSRSDLIEIGKSRYSILAVKEVKEISVDRIRSQIRHRLISVQKTEQFRKYIDELKEKNNVEVEIL